MGKISCLNNGNKDIIILNNEQEVIMKFFKGILVGTMFAAGTAIMYKEGMLNGSKFMKKGKKIAKKIGFM